MKKLMKIGIVAAVLAVGGSAAYAWVTNTITWGGAGTIHADAGVLGSDSFVTPGNAVGFVCTIATPGASMNGGTVYTPGFFQQVSNDGVNWATVDAGAVPGAGIAPAATQVSDAGPYQYVGELLPLPFQYSRLATSAVTAAGELTCTVAHAN